MADKIFTKKVPDPRLPSNRFVQLNKQGTLFIPHPDDVPGKTPGKKLWEERLEEARKTNPKCTKEDMCWGIADVPDNYQIGSFYIEQDGKIS